jgi:hypothetical protein
MRPKHPLFRHSEHLEQALFLIREQLKSRRFFNAMRSLGLGDTSGEVHLEALILDVMCIDDGSDEVMKFISSLLDKHAQGLSDNMEEIDKNALIVYVELLNKWKEMNSEP